jgi:hypothetical protein
MDIFKEVKFWVGLVLGLLVLGAGAFAIYSYNSAITRADKAEKHAAEVDLENATLRATLKKRQEQFDNADEISRQRGIRIGILEKELQASDDKFRTLQAQSKPDRDWAATPVPDATRVLRRVNAGCSADLALPCPGTEPGANTRAPDDGRDKRRTPTGGGSPSDGATDGERGQS